VKYKSTRSHCCALGMTKLKQKGPAHLLDTFTNQEQDSRWTGSRPGCRKGKLVPVPRIGKKAVKTKRKGIGYCAGKGGMLRFTGG